MRMPRRKYLIGAAALVVLVAGVAEAASTQLHTMNVTAPDGSVVHVAYAGDVAPKVQVVPADAARSIAIDPFARMDQISAMMDAQMQEMMQRAAMMRQQAQQMQQRAVATGQAAQVAPGVTMVSAQNGSAANAPPKGMHVTYYSSSTDARGCTRSTSYSSDGSGAQPKVTQAASDGCDAARPNAAAIPAKAEKPAGQKAAGEATGPGQKV